MLFDYSQPIVIIIILAFVHMAANQRVHSAFEKVEELMLMTENDNKPE